MLISSRANPRFKAARLLNRHRHRTAAGRFLIETEDLVRLALDSGVGVSELWLCPELGAELATWEQVPVPTYTVPADLFSQLAYRRKPDGHLAVASIFPTTLDGLDLEGADSVLVAAGIEKPGNLGAMLRTAHAFAADAVIAADAAIDFFNPNVVRASLGALFRVPVAAASGSDVRTVLGAAGLKMIPTSVRGARDLWATDLSVRCAIVVGSEDQGLGPEWDPAGTQSLHIPVTGPGGSLNVSVAAAVILAETHRQRHYVT